MTVLRIAAGAAPLLSRSRCKNLECVVRVLEIQMPSTLRKSARAATKERRFLYRERYRTRSS